MKTLICCLTVLISSLFLFTNDAYSQSSDKIPIKCKWNLKDTLFSSVDSIVGISYGKSTIPNNCKDVSYDADKDETNCPTIDTCLYGVQLAGTLIYDVYFPVLDDTTIKMPVIILLHPGGFEECSKYNQFEIRYICREFARRGFCVMNVEYRRGRVIDPNRIYIYVQQELAFYRVMQDCRGAIRSIIKHQRNYNDFHDRYRIDTSQIFLCGMSAGGVGTITAALYSTQMVYDVFPTATGSVSIQSALGPVNADYYYGDTTINYQPLIKGIATLWSGAPIPISFRTNHNEKDFFTNGIKPVIGFHGALDEIFPFDTTSVQNIVFPPRNDPFYTPYLNENRCLIDTPYKLEGLNAQGTNIKLFISSTLDIYAVTKAIDSTKLDELYVSCSMHHGLDPNNNFHSDFGTGDTTRFQVYLYIVQRVCIFFQAIMNNKTASDIGPPSKFVDCENYRIKCNGPSNDSCSNSRVCSTSN